jgi:hypothetical protein
VEIYKPQQYNVYKLSYLNLLISSIKLRHLHIYARNHFYSYLQFQIDKITFQILKIDDVRNL